jgi:hypothetical protein
MSFALQDNIKDTQQQLSAVVGGRNTRQSVLLSNVNDPQWTFLFIGHTI